MAVLVTCSLELSVNALCVSLGSVFWFSFVRAVGLHEDLIRSVPIFYAVARFQLAFTEAKGPEMYPKVFNLNKHTASFSSP